ncbi:XVIPCD domain-containing protein [Stenotrophomonas koreensis]|uniref:XVIPCD domain-containing protein n=1 Tax=Stenotrophomonas koreensis TaxID=266128 RepID=UPI000A4ABB32|nr:XVIPCD domain-containing protein [Stenotrophomonas koreensis]
MNQPQIQQPPLDIRAEAQRIGTELSAGRWESGLAQLQQHIDSQPQIISEAILRYVAADQSDALARLGRATAINIPADAAGTIEALLHSKGPPRYFNNDEIDLLPKVQQYDVYASILAIRGNAEAMGELAAGNRVLLGMRQDTHTALNRGQGAYDDRIVVLWRDATGPDVAPFHRANTEPTAQYQAHAAARQEPFDRVIHRSVDGMDVNADGLRDLGRLAEGSYRFAASTHQFGNRSETRHFALRPTAESVTSSPNGVQRDSNGDGWFDSADSNGVQPLNSTFKFHRGGVENTDSAGCQTIPRTYLGNNNYYEEYSEAVRGNAAQREILYVLTSTHIIEERLQGHSRVPEPLAFLPDPRLPGHADHTLYEQIHRGVRGLGGQFAANADTVSLGLLLAARNEGWNEVVAVRASHPIAEQAEAERLFLVRDGDPDPARNRLGILSNDLLRANSHQLLEQLSAPSPIAESTVVGIGEAEQTHAMGAVR